jgi:hypothetical protein
MENNKSVVTPAINGIVAEIKTILESARSNAARQVNTELLNTYWNIGRINTENVRIKRFIGVPTIAPKPMPSAV